MPADELLDEGDAIAAPDRVGPVGVDKKSVIVRFSYPPQEMDLKRGDDLKTRDEKGFGKVWAVDRNACTVDIRGNEETLERAPESVFSHTVVKPEAMQESLLALGERFLASPAAEGSCGMRLLLRTPRESLDEDPIRRVLSLDGDFLALQGPPGSGKTRTGARMILALVEKGFRVGITAVSHKVIRNLLDEVRSAAVAEGRTIRIGQKPKERSPEPPAGIEEEPDNKKFAQRLNAGAWDVAGATSWFWARGEARDSVHTLFVDEAGQMSLASTLAAVARGAQPGSPRRPAAAGPASEGDPPRWHRRLGSRSPAREGGHDAARARSFPRRDLAAGAADLRADLRALLRGKLGPRAGAGLERQVLSRHRRTRWRRVVVAAGRTPGSFDVFTGRDRSRRGPRRSPASAGGDLVRPPRRGPPPARRRRAGGGALQRPRHAARRTPPLARGESRDGRQVPGPRGAGGDLHHGGVERRRRPAGHGVPVQSRTASTSRPRAPAAR